MYAIFDLMDECRNHFVAGWREGTFEIADGVMDVAGAPACAFVAMGGSIWHATVGPDGVTLDLDGEKPEDGRFAGRISFLAPPRQFVALADEVEAWNKKYPVSPYTSESMAPYSYTKAQGRNGGVMTWQDAFGNRLGRWRRMFDDLEA